MIEILTGDFRELSRDLADDSIDLVLTEPPYPKEYLPLWEDLGRVAARVLRPSGFLVSYSGKMYLPEIMAMLSKHLCWYWLGVLHHQGPKKRLWRYRILEAQKAILVYQKPPFESQPGFFVDLVDSPTQSKHYHQWGQNVAPFMRLVETFSEPSNLVLDPLLGGGTTAVACLRTNRRFVGYEIDPDAAETARRRVAREKLFIPQHDPVQLTIETIGLPRCKFCGAILDSNGGPGRKREYCNDNCRLKAFRFRQAELKRNAILEVTP